MWGGCMVEVKQSNAVAADDNDVVVADDDDDVVVDDVDVVVIAGSRQCDYKNLTMCGDCELSSEMNQLLLAFDDWKVSYHPPFQTHHTTPHHILYVMIPTRTHHCGSLCSSFVPLRF